jgi:hypothetical protein
MQSAILRLPIVYLFGRKIMTENTHLATYPATSSDVPRDARTEDCYIEVDVCKSFKYQIDMSAQKPDVFHAWTKGSESLRTLVDHSIRIKGADALRGYMQDVFGEPNKAIRENYTAYATQIGSDPEKLSKVREYMISWCWEGKVTKPKTLEAQLAECIAAQGKIVQAAKAGKYVTTDNKQKAKAQLTALVDKRAALEAQLADQETDLDELFD